MVAARLRGFAAATAYASPYLRGPWSGPKGTKRGALLGALSWGEFVRQWLAQWRALIRRFLVGQARDPARSIRDPFHVGASLPPPPPSLHALPAAPPRAEALDLSVCDIERIQRDAVAAAQSLRAVCPACDAAFASVAALAVQERLRRGSKRPWHRFVIDGWYVRGGDCRSWLRCPEDLERGGRVCPCACASPGSSFVEVRLPFQNPAGANPQTTLVVGPAGTRASCVGCSF